MAVPEISADKSYLNINGLTTLWAKTKEYVDNKLSSQSSSSAPTVTMETHDSPASGDEYSVAMADNQTLLVTCVNSKGSVRNCIVSSSQLDSDKHLGTVAEPNASFDIRGNYGTWVISVTTTGLQSITIIDIH